MNSRRACGARNNSDTRLAEAGDGKADLIRVRSGRVVSAIIVDVPSFRQPSWLMPADLRYTSESSSSRAGRSRARASCRCESATCRVPRFEIVIIIIIRARSLHIYII